MKRIAVPALIVVVIVAVKLTNRSGAQKDVWGDMKTLVAQLDCYPKNTEYLDKLVEREHAAAFDAAYTTGDRRRADKFDERKYLSELFGDMIAECGRAKKPDVAAELTKLQDTLLSAEIKTDQP